MPYIDFNKKPITDYTYPFDYTIIGAGVAGILLAVKLAEKGKTVLLIESGHFEEDDKRQELNRVEQTGKTVENAINGRKRAVGGTSIAWGGQSLPFSKLDFEEKPWVENSGWRRKSIRGRRRKYGNLSLIRSFFRHLFPLARRS